MCDAKLSNEIGPSLQCRYPDSSSVMLQAIYSFAAGAAYGGACYYSEGVDNHVTSSTFMNNSAALSGGAIAVQG